MILANNKLKNKMKSAGLILLSLMMLNFSACKLCKNKDKEVADKSTPQTTIQKIIVDDNFTTPANNVSSDIIKTSIEGNILTIEVSYSGGCEEHDFKLYFNGMYKKSLPPKADFVLVHDNKGDACRSIVEKKLKFDISASQYVGSKEMMVTVNGFQEMSYTY
jgi:hypothetical protein